VIYKFQPFSTDKTQFGNQYNAHCGLLPNDDDWALILDYDAMILDPRAYTIIDKAIQAHHEAEIFTALASRIGYHEQRLDPNTIDNTDSILHHKAIAANLAETYPNGECAHITSAAGFFLLFQRKYWVKNPFQPTIQDRDGRLFDWNFCLPAMKRHTIRLIRGVYCWHTYRLGQENIRNGDHLR